MFKIQYFSLQTKRTSFQLLLCVSIECVITEELVSSLNRFESDCICKMRHSYDQIMCTLYRNRLPFQIFESGSPLFSSLRLMSGEPVEGLQNDLATTITRKMAMATTQSSDIHPGKCQQGRLLGLPTKLCHIKPSRKIVPSF